MIKYKILGITLFLAIIIFVWLMTSYKTGIERILFERKKIDSILVVRNDTISCIADDLSITHSVALLKKSNPIPYPERLNINTGQVHVFFYTKEGIKKMRFIYCFYEGTVFKTNFKYYRNDELHDFFITSLKSNFRLK